MDVLCKLQNSETEVCLLLWCTLNRACYYGHIISLEMDYYRSENVCDKMSCKIICCVIIVRETIKGENYG